MLENDSVTIAIDKYSVTISFDGKNIFFNVANLT